MPLSYEELLKVMPNGMRIAQGPQREEGLDYGGIVEQSLEGVASGLSALPEYAGGQLAQTESFPETGRLLRQYGRERRQYWDAKQLETFQGLDPYTQEALSKKWLDYENVEDAAFNVFGPQGADPIIAQTISSAPYILPSLVGSGLVGVGGAVAGAAGAVGWGGRMLGLTGRALQAFEGAEIGGAVAADIAKGIDDASLEELQASPYFAQVLDETGDEQAARNALIARAQSVLVPIAGVGGGALGFVGGVGPRSGGVLKRVFKAAGEEALQEAGQSALEQTTQNIGAQESYDPDRDITEGVGEAVVSGAALGGILGGPFGIPRGARSSTDLTTGNQTDSGESSSIEQQELFPKTPGTALPSPAPQGPGPDLLPRDGRERRAAPPEPQFRPPDVVGQSQGQLALFPESQQGVGEQLELPRSDLFGFGDAEPALPADQRPFLDAQTGLPLPPDDGDGGGQPFRPPESVQVGNIDVPGQRPLDLRQADTGPQYFVAPAAPTMEQLDFGTDDSDTLLKGLQRGFLEYFRQNEANRAADDKNPNAVRAEETRGINQFLDQFYDGRRVSSDGLRVLDPGALLEPDMMRTKLYELATDPETRNTLSGRAARNMLQRITGLPVDNRDAERFAGDYRTPAESGDTLESIIGPLAGNINRLKPAARQASTISTWLLGRNEELIPTGAKRGTPLVERNPALWTRMRELFRAYWQLLNVQRSLAALTLNETYEQKMRQIVGNADLTDEVKRARLDEALNDLQGELDKARSKFNAISSVANKLSETFGQQKGTNDTARAASNSGAAMATAMDTLNKALRGPEGRGAARAPRIGDILLNAIASGEDTAVVRAVTDAFNELEATARVMKTERDRLLDNYREVLDIRGKKDSFNEYLRRRTEPAGQDRAGRPDQLDVSATQAEVAEDYLQSENVFASFANRRMPTDNTAMQIAFRGAFQRAAAEVAAEEAKATSKTRSEPAAQEPTGPIYSEKVGALAERLGVDINEVTGTGKGGRVLVPDVRKYSRAKAAASEVNQRAAEVERQAKETAEEMAQRDVAPKAEEAKAKSVARGSVAATNLAKEFNVDMNDVTPTGKKGDVTKKDILSYVKARGEAVAKASKAEAAKETSRAKKAPAKKAPAKKAPAKKAPAKKSDKPTAVRVVEETLEDTEEAQRRLFTIIANDDREAGLKELAARGVSAERDRGAPYEPSAAEVVYDALRETHLAEIAQAAEGVAETEPADVGTGEPEAAVPSDEVVEPADSGDGGSGRPGVQVYDESLIPKPRVRIKRSEYKDYPDEHQVLGAELALSRLDDGKPFLLADGTGVGKTVQILMVANEWLKKPDQGNVVIVVPNKSIVAGSYTADAKAMNIDLSKFNIVTYNDISAGKVKGQPDLIIYDESQALANPNSKRSLAAEALNAKSTMYVSATPSDTQAGMYFLANLMGISYDRFLGRIGLIRQPKFDKNGAQAVDADGAPIFTIQQKPGFSYDRVLKELGNVRREMVEEGAVLRRDFPFYGNIELRNVPYTDEQAQQSEDVLAYFDQKIEREPSHTKRRFLKGQRTNAHSTWTEAQKIDAAVELATEEVRNGRQVVIFAEGVNPTKSDALKKFGLPGTVTEIVKRLRAAGITTANLSAAQNIAGDVSNFNNGVVKVIVGTTKKGGAGINLDDTKGNAPRTLIMVTTNFSASVVDQALGRVSRRNSKTPSNVYFLYNDLLSDSRRKAILERKTRQMDLVRKGQATEFFSELEEKRAKEEGRDLDTPSAAMAPTTPTPASDTMPNGYPEFAAEMFGTPVRGATKRLYDAMRRKQGQYISAKEALTLIGKHSVNPYRKQLAKMLAALDLNLPVRIATHNDIQTHLQGGQGSVAFAVYRFRQANDNEFTEREILVADDLRDAERSILHEAIHAATRHAMTDDSVVALELDKLYRHVREHMELNESEWLNRHVMSSLSEFVEGVFNQPDFQLELSRIPGVKSEKTAWDSLLDLIRNLVVKLRSITNRSRGVNSALEEAVALSTQLLQRGDDIRPNLSRSIVKRTRGLTAGKAQEDFDLALSDIGPNLRQETTTRYKQFVNTGRPFKLGALGLRQIVRSYGQLSSHIEDFGRQQHAKEIEVRRRMLLPDTISVAWTALPLEQITALNETMTESTIWRAHPDKPLTHADNKHLFLKDGTPKSERALKEHARLAKKYKEELSNDAKKVYQDAQKYFIDDANEIRSQIIQNMLALNKLDRALVGIDTPAKDIKKRVNVLNEKGEVNETASKELQEAIGQVKAMFQSKGPYFPLKRFGDWVVAIKAVKQHTVADADAATKLRKELREEHGPYLSLGENIAADGGQITFEATLPDVQMFETQAQAEQHLRSIKPEINALRSSGEWDKVDVPVEPALKRRTVNQMAAVSGDFLNRVEKQLKGDKRAVNAVRMAFLELLPDTSVLKGKMRRRNAKGSTRDMHRAFSSYARASAHYMGQLKYGQSLARALEGMEEDSRALQYSSTGQPRLQAVINELRKRDKFDSDLLDRNTAVEVVNNVGFLNFLTTPSYWFVNSTQPYMFSLPYMSARHGIGKTTSAMIEANKLLDGEVFKRALSLKGGNKALAEVFRLGEVNLTKHVQKSNAKDKQRVVEMLTQLANQGLIDLTFATNLREVAEQGNPSNWTRVMDWARVMPHLVEVMNRGVTAVSAYRLEMDRTGDHQASILYAEKVVAETQFDYSGANKPRYFSRQQVGVLQPVFMFKQHAQNVYYLMLKSFYDTFWGADSGLTGAERAEAAKILFGVLATHVAMAGAIGAMFEPAKIALGAALALFGDPDDPQDLETLIRRAVYLGTKQVIDDEGVVTAKNVAEAMTRGLPRVFDVDLSNRVSIDNMLFMDPSGSKSGRDAFTSLVMQALGPIPAMVGNYFAAWELASKGATMQAVEQAAPKLIRDGLRAARLNSGGLTDYNGNVILAADSMDAIDIFYQAAGFTPSIAAETYEGRAAVTNVEKSLDNRRRKLIERWRREDNAGKADMWTGDIREFNRANPEFKISRSTLLKSRKAQRDRERNTARNRGAYIAKTRRRALQELGEFAAVEDAQF